MFTCNFDRPPYFKFSGPVQHFHIWYDEYDWRKFWKRFSGCFDLESRVSRKTVVKLMMLTSSQWPGVVIFVSKQRTYVLCLWSIVRYFQCFVRGSPTSGKVVSHEPPYPLEIAAFEPPLPLGISNDLPWGEGGVWIFSGTTHYYREHAYWEMPHSFTKS